MATLTDPPSPVETIKAASRRLRGSLAESLDDALTGAIRADDTQLIKFHGSYQQDDRDLREERRAQKLEPAYSFMIRTRTPGGVVTPQQWLALDAIATTYANGTLRLTTRQAFQFHGVIKRDLKATIQAINRSLVDSIAACGDVNRNVMVSANPVQSQAHAAVYDWARRLSEHLKPQTRAYYEIWLDEQKVAGSGEEDEPIYGPVYLPRKFKTALAIPPFNDVDLFANDLGFIAIIDAGVLQGFNVAVGGGLGAAHGDARTYPRLAEVIGFVPPERLLAVAEAVVTAQRDLGNRSDRKLSRLKYTIDRLGLPAFKAEVERRLGEPLPAARPYAFEHSGDRYGWVEGHDGAWHLGLRIESGRVADRGERRHLAGLRAIARIHTGDFRLTGNQNLVIAGVAPAARAAIDRLVAEHGLDDHRRATPVRRNALACVALPTCALAMAEAERYLSPLLARIEERLAAHALADAPIGLRISGCPNGCSRPYLGEIGLVGKAPGRYNLMLGADARGQRLNRLHRENIDEPQILAELDGLFARYADQRHPGEGFGDFLVRSGIVAVPAPPSLPLEPPQ
ncbi:assimilatory sulfite reductase (NADPH) hemoprotein subunit [Dokdonella koreensis]|uniref:Sulfite reductase [NADPH] hemoprotein beta-component n=1 Tax=Dokdonella koreensis DS-123 TaxID=1300342 RepID=A0A160DU89_9GAMM|nr:assimilatory sulfite reductase (NADPH) hemoprotein subunit [Dokdonella koreensis]ANB17591.1 Sulfite reductase, hemoprotein beta-component [Dokdonella koreensis DS-123]